MLVDISCLADSAAWPATITFASPDIIFQNVYRSQLARSGRWDDRDLGIFDPPPPGRLPRTRSAKQQIGWRVLHHGRLRQRYYPPRVEVRRIRSRIAARYGTMAWWSPP